jgi:hypothetical protein
MGTATFPLVFARGDLPADTPNLPLSHGDSALDAPALAAFSGDIVAIGVSLSADCTAGSATFQIRVNGEKIATPVAVIDPATARRIIVNIGHEGLQTVKPGDTIDVVATTNAGWLPISAAVSIDVWCTVGSYAPG